MLISLEDSGIAIVAIKRFWFVTWSQTTTCLTGYVTLWVESSHNKATFTTFSGHRPCCKRHIADLLFHATLQNHVINRPCGFMKARSSFYIPSLPSLVAISIMLVEIKWFNLSRDFATTADQLTKTSSNVTGRRPSR